MVGGEVSRRLAAIVAADVAGYSRLVSNDEEGTLGALRAHRSDLIDPKIAEFGGRIANTAGDSILIEFSSVVDALRCCIDIQKGMVERNADVHEERRITFRVGINVGDVVEQDGDLLGDGVNVAARLEGLAEPGGICLSRSARDQIRDRQVVALEDMGEVEVKNIVRPVRVFRVLGEGETVSVPTRKFASWRKYAVAAFIALAILTGGGAWWWNQADRLTSTHSGNAALTLPDKPSIAVLPFDNVSTNKEQAYFSDGVTEDIITDLSKISGLFVVARNSSFSYKGKPVEVRQVAEELGVRYVLQGSVRRAEEKIRITTQLIDAPKGNHIWAERYDRELKDVFAVQSEVARQVAKALAVTLKANENERLYQKYTANIDAYDVYLQARRTVDAPTKDNILRGEKLFSRVIALDPNFAGGYAGLSFNLSVQVRFQYSKSPAADVARAFDLAKQAIEVDSGFVWGHIALGGAYLAKGDAEAAVGAVRQALALDPNGYEANLFMGFYLQFAGDSALAVKHLLKSRRLSPVESVRDRAFMSLAQFMNRNYAETVRFGGGRNPNSRVVLAAAYTLLERPDEAAVMVKKLLTANPKFNLSQWRFGKLWQSEENRTRLYSAAKKAGIPEFPKDK